VIIAVTVFLGLAVPVLVVAVSDSSDRTFATVSSATVSLMSIPLPFLGALLAIDLHRTGQDPGRVGPVLAVATLIAVAAGALGGVASAIAVASSGGAAGVAGAAGPWSRAGTIALGCLLVCVVAQFVGTGFGLLLPHPVVACAATIVVPLGLWLVLGLDFLRAAQPWLTPFASVPRLLSGDMSGLAWTQWTVMALLWAGGLNALGAARLRRQARRPSRDTGPPVTSGPVVTPVRR
jgi:hypothetical protein